MPYPSVTLLSHPSLPLLRNPHLHHAASCLDSILIPCSPITLAPMDLSATKKSQNQYFCDKWMAKYLCLYCRSVDHFKNQYPILASNNAQKVHLGAMSISTPDVDSIPSAASDSGKE
jgi:hypothetical protein